MGNTGISRGTGNKGKSPSHLHISFPTRDRLHCTPMSRQEATEKPGKGKLDKID